MNGALAVYHLANANTATPSIAGGTGAGASPSVAVTGSDIAGKISITTGISPSGSNTTIATVTFNVPYTASPYVILTPADGTTALLSGTTMVYIGAATSTGFVLTSGTAALAASTSYSFYYHVIQ
jgi:hypothetical protein